MEERRHSLKTEEIQLSNALLQYLTAVTETDPLYLITSATQVGSGRLFVDRNISLPVDVIVERVEDRLTRGLSDSFEQALVDLKVDAKKFEQAERLHGIHKKISAQLKASVELQKEFYELGKQAFGSSPERAEASVAAASIIKKYFDRLLASNPDWVRFEANQKKTLRTLYETQLSGDELERKIETTWNTMVNHIAGGVAFSLQSFIVENAPQLGIQRSGDISPQQVAADLYKNYVNLFNDGFIKVEDNAHDSNVEQELSTIIRKSLELDTLEGFLKKTSPAEIEHFCDIKLKTIDRQIYRGKDIARRGEVGEAIIHKLLKEMLEKMATLKKQSKASKDKQMQKKIGQALETMANMLLEDTNKRFNNEALKTRSPESLKALDELNKTMMMYAKRKEKKKYSKFAKTVEAMVKNNVKEKQHEESEKLKGHGKEKEKEIQFTKNTKGTSKKVPLLRRLSSQRLLERKLTPKSLNKSSSDRELEKETPLRSTEYWSPSGKRRDLPTNLSGEDLKSTSSNEDLRSSGEKVKRPSRLPRTQSGDNLRRQKVDTKLSKSGVIPVKKMPSHYFPGDEESGAKLEYKTVLAYEKKASSADSVKVSKNPHATFSHSKSPLTEGKQSKQVKEEDSPKPSERKKGGPG